MPRKDGFPTNPEMIADLTETSRQIYVAAFNREVENGLHPALLDKPLSMVTYRVTTLYSPESETNLAAEYLSVEPLTHEHLDSGLEFRNPPCDRDIINLRRQQAAAVGAVALTPDLAIENVLRPGHAMADYWTQFIDRRASSVDTFSERPAKIVIGSALAYSSAYLKLLQAAEDERKNDGMAFLQVLNRRSAYEDRVLPEDTRGAFHLRIMPELPLNGSESTDFLRRFYGQMREELAAYQGGIDHIKEIDPASSIAQEAEARLALLADAKARAKKLIEARGEET